MDFLGQMQVKNHTLMGFHVKGHNFFPFSVTSEILRVDIKKKRKEKTSKDYKNTVGLNNILSGEESDLGE